MKYVCEVCGYEYDEALGCFVARFVLTKNATVMVAGVL